VLLENGAQIEARDTNGYTALYLTTISQKVDEEVVKKFGASPVYQEPLSQHTEVVRLLKQALSQKPLASFAESVNDLQKNPYDDATREKAIKLAVGLTALPPIPEDARQLFLQASALIKQTSTAQELQKPIELLGKALIIAPWWGNAYYNLSRAQELSGHYDEAVKQLNNYLELKPTEAEASEARAHIAVIQAEKEATASKQQANESVLAVKYVSGGITRVRYDDEPAWWHGIRGIDDLYTYEFLEKEDPFDVNVFRMPNGKLLAIYLVAQSNNGAYAGDQIGVDDITDKSCIQGGAFLFGQRSYTEPCGAHYDVNVSNQPNATVTVTYPTTGASVTLPVAVLYRGRTLKGNGMWGTCSDGTVYQGGKQAMVLHFDCSVVKAAEDPTVNAMGLTPTTVTPYQSNK
jgi:hypothetical protein